MTYESRLAELDKIVNAPLFDESYFNGDRLKKALAAMEAHQLRLMRERTPVMGDDERAVWFKQAVGNGISVEAIAEAARIAEADVRALAALP